MDALQVDIAVPLRSFELELTLDVGDETVALVGPSGAGKTTVLRAVAGLVRPRAGRIVLGPDVLFDAEAKVDLPPEDRRVGFVFQEYALFPHLTVRQNVAYGGEERADELLARFRIGHLRDARPAQLSGGERQRVGLARALARDPAVLLLDEPLSALDAHTRAEVRAELRELLQGLGLPTLLVTHDFEDAAALASRVGVIADGKVLQLGTPLDLVAGPSSPFVASFTGGNLVHGSATSSEGSLTRVALADGAVVWSADTLDGPVGVVVYPWEISLSLELPHDSARNHLETEVSSIVPLGNRVRVRAGSFVAEVTPEAATELGLEPGRAIVASFKATATRLVPLLPPGRRV